MRYLAERFRRPTLPDDSVRASATNRRTLTRNERKIRGKKNRVWQIRTRKYKLDVTLAVLYGTGKRRSRALRVDFRGDCVFFLENNNTNNYY